MYLCSSAPSDRLLTWFIQCSGWSTQSKPLGGPPSSPLSPLQPPTLPTPSLRYWEETNISYHVQLRGLLHVSIYIVITSPKGMNRNDWLGGEPFYNMLVYLLVCVFYHATSIINVLRLLTLFSYVLPIRFQPCMTLVYSWPSSSAAAGFGCPSSCLPPCVSGTSGSSPGKMPV